MSNPSKKKGTAAETKVVKACEAEGLVAERLALHGASDLGDVRITLDIDDYIILEVKAGKQTASPNRALLTEWKRQTSNEINSYQMQQNVATRIWGALVVVRFNRQLKDADVYLPNSIWTEDEANPYWVHMYFDEFIALVKTL